MNGEVQEPGHKFVLADGELGPHTTRIVQHERHCESGNAYHDDFFQGKYGAIAEDVPLYTVIEELPA